MKQIIYQNNRNYIIATTLKDDTKEDMQNLALHATNNAQGVINNRQMLADYLQIPITNMVFANQTHSDHFYEVCANDLGKGLYDLNSAIADCDALYTKLSNVVIGVFSADCVPILLYDETSGIIAAIHSGWLGTTKEILNKTLQHLITKENLNPKTTYAYIGICIDQTTFEVGLDVINKLQQMSFDTSSFIKMISQEKALVDQKGINQQMLLNNGILQTNIMVESGNTMTNPLDCFSYRLDKQCGRHYSYIMKK